MNRNPDVDAWFAKKDHPLESMLQRAREIILGADERVTETIKWQTPTFAYKGNIISFNPAKKLVSLMFHQGAKIPGDHPRLEGTGDDARVMRFETPDELEAGKPELEAAVRAWCDMKDGK